MRCVFDLFSGSSELVRCDWTIVGKGPGFIRVAFPGLLETIVLCLNQAAKKAPICDFAHAIDLEVALELAPWCMETGMRLIMPWQPHINCGLGAKTLDDIVKTEKTIGLLSEADLLFWYNHSYAKRRNKNSHHVVPVKYFSAEAALGILAIAGVKRVRTVGVDGGKEYAAVFDQKDKLRNGQPSFDLQFKGMRETAERYHMEVTSI